MKSERKYYWGFRGNGQVLYGKDHTGNTRTMREGAAQYAEPMTLCQARGAIVRWKKTFSGETKERSWPVVFMAVEVKP